MLTIKILTLFPEYFQTPLEQSIIARALAQGLAEVVVVDIRQFATDKHRKTDDRPFGGGPGMVMMVEPIDKALEFAKNSSPPPTRTTRVILTSAKGDLYTQEKALSYAELDELIIVCGHYEGVDERVAEHLVDEEVRIGDYVLTGGESAALVIADSVIRLLPGVLGNALSLDDESHSAKGELSYPQYTRPREYRGWVVPEELLEGNHAEIDKWRSKQKKKS